jgi:ankyrin repeat domain-containing protein 50
VNYYEKVSSIFTRLGTSWALHQDFAQLFPSSTELQAYLLEYMITVISLCKKTVLFSRESTMKQFTSSLLSTFEGEFGPLISELDQWGKLIEQRTNLLATQLTNKADENAVI